MENKFRYYDLDWDNKYFEIECGKVVLNDTISDKEMDYIIEYCRKWDFTTIVNSNNNSQNNITLGKKSEAFLTDINIQFKKNVEKKKYIYDDKIRISDKFPSNEDILNITKKTFEKSRFFNDMYLDKSKSRSVYCHWINCAFNKLNKYYITYNDGGRIVGYLLFNLNYNESTATIELIGIDTRYKGRGIGKKLIYSLENFAYKKDMEYINVGTQVDNISAINFYIKSEFKYIGCSSIYHLWLDK